MNFYYDDFFCERYTFVVTQPDPVEPPIVTAFTGWARIDEWVEEAL